MNKHHNIHYSPPFSEDNLNSEWMSSTNVKFINPSFLRTPIEDTLNTEWDKKMPPKSNDKIAPETKTVVNNLISKYRNAWERLAE